MLKNNEKNTGNQSLIRGLQLIDILSNYPNGCPLAKLSELANLNKSTVHRLLQGLQQQGFVQNAMTFGNYRLTMKCLTIGQKIFSSLNINYMAAPYLEKLNLDIGETVNFSIRENDHAVLIYKLEPITGMMQTRAYIGQRIQLYNSAMGKLYIAYDKADYIYQYWERNKHQIKPLTHNTIIDLNKMLREIEIIQQQGYAFDNEEGELGISCIACPIFDYKNEVKYTISISLSTLKLKNLGLNNLLNELKKASESISKELGWKA